MPWMGAYFASKAAVWQFSAAMALEVASAGIQVAVVQPGGYKTDWQTDSLWVAARTETGGGPHGEQTRAALAAVRAFSEGWKGPDDFGRRASTPTRSRSGTSSPATTSARCWSRPRSSASRRWRSDSAK